MTYRLYNTFTFVLLGAVILIACGDDDGAGVDASSDATVDGSAEDTSEDSLGLDASEQDVQSDSTEDVADLDVPEDSGPLCVFTYEDGLSEECLPACTQATYETVVDCGPDRECVDAARQADETERTVDEQPEGVAAVWFRNDDDVSYCRRCEYYQTATCWYAACPEETTTFFDCLSNLLRDCTDEGAALSACTSSDDGYLECYRNTYSSCF